MCIAMETAFQCFSFLILFSLHKLAYPSCNTSGKVNVSEILYQNEGSFLNISYLLNISENSVSTDTSRLSVEVCQNNNRSSLCNLIRPKKFQDFTVKYSDVGDDTLCVAERRYFTSSMRTWEIKISMLLTRSITAIYLDIQYKTLHIQTVMHIPIDVTYPSEVTNLTVEGQEVNSTHLINEGEDVNVCCSYNRGNPPAVFNLLDTNRMEIANKVDKNIMETKRGEEHLKVSLSVRCQDDWPTVRCEGNESKRNRSVSLLVRCAPQFIDGPVTLVSSEFEKVSFRVKAHTTIFNKCSLTPTPLQNTSIPKVKCNLSGEPPYLVLTLHPEENIYQGSWKITLGNERGSANTTVNITEYSMSETTAPSVESVCVLTISFSCGGVLLAVVITIVVIFVKITTKENENGVQVQVYHPSTSASTSQGWTQNEPYGDTPAAKTTNRSPNQCLWRSRSGYVFHDHELMKDNPQRWRLLILIFICKAKASMSLERCWTERRRQSFYNQGKHRHRNNQTEYIIVTTTIPPPQDYKQKIYRSNKK